VKVTQGSVPVEDLVEEVQNAIRIANIGSGSQSDLRVKTAQLVLNVVATRSSGAKVDFRIPVIGTKLVLGTKVSHEDTHVIDVTLVPPPSDEHEVRDGNVARVLVEAIATVQRIMRKAAEGSEKLVLDAGAVEISFVVTEEGTLSLGFDGELRNAVTHTIKLELATADR